MRFISEHTQRSFELEFTEQEIDDMYTALLETLSRRAGPHLSLSPETSAAFREENARMKALSENLVNSIPKRAA